MTTLKESLWSQFGASIDMLENAIAACPDNMWGVHDRFFYISYHSLVFLDYYLSIPPVNFIAMLPYTLVGDDNIPENAVDDIVPNRIYEKKELLNYLQATREKCRNFISNLTEEKLNEPWISGSGEMNLTLTGADAQHFSVFEILLYNMRHVQHHTAQLNQLLRITINDAPNYITTTKQGLI